MDKSERIFKLHTLLRNHGPASMHKIRDTLQVSRATAMRDMDYMRTFMNAPIIYQRETYGYHYDPAAPVFELPGLWFSAAELHALLACEQILENMQPGILSPHLGPLRLRLRELLEKSGHDAATIISRIRLQKIGARRVEHGHFGVVAQAVLSGRVLDMAYHDRNRGQITQRRIHPRQLWHYRNNWYLVAWCEQAQALRTFSLDRIRAPRLGAAPVTPVDETHLHTHLDASFGIFTGPAKAWAVLRFSSHMARWVADESWHPKQHGEWHGEEYILRVPYADPRELMMDILKYGPEVEVLEPVELRVAVAERLREAAGKYFK